MRRSIVFFLFSVSSLPLWSQSSDWMMSESVAPHRFEASQAVKHGIVLDLNADSMAFDAGMVESPSIHYDDSLQCYVMVYTAYDRRKHSSIGWATSTDLLHWQRRGVLLRPSGNVDNGDAMGTTGPCLLHYRGVYYLFYLGLNTAGYEGRPIHLCLATSSSLSADSWTYRGVVIPTQPSGWADRAIFHPCVCKVDGKWYCFFNAEGTVDGEVAERTGFATADALEGPWHVEPERISQFAERRAKGLAIQCGDPSLFMWRGLVYMFYFNLSNGVVDHWAWTTKGEIPRGWRYGGVCINKTAEDDKYAHKPFVLIKDGTLYHFYTAVTRVNRRRIALQTFQLHTE